MEATEIGKLVALEDRHWWYRERRALLTRLLRHVDGRGRALDVGAAGGGNTRVLQARGWGVVALEMSPEGAAAAADRGLAAVRADGRHIPIASESVDLVVAFDILEHIEEDHEAAAEISRVLRPGGVALIAVPADMRLWSAHDVAVGHVRRYSRDSLSSVLVKAGLEIDDLWSWNVLLRPIATWRRRRSTGSDLDRLPGFVNAGLTAVIVAERYLPVKSWPGVSLVARVHR